jgi:hypothetical protein
MTAEATSSGTTPSDGNNLRMDGQLPDQIMPLPYRPWPEAGYRPLPHVLQGALLGGLAGCTSLLANVIGGLFWTSITGYEMNPLRIIQVFLTVPMGDAALQLNGGSVLALGCVLYLLTGVVYGAIFEFMISYYLPHADVRARFVTFTILAIAVWIINFYGLLIWLQPLFFGGRWIYELIPWWVAALTHLAFGWTLALVNSIDLRGKHCALNSFKSAA